MFALKGIIVYTPALDSLEIHENEYVIVNDDGTCKGIYAEIPEAYKDIKVYDYTDCFIFPGMCDMHLHAPQYGFRGMGQFLENDSEWETWFDIYSFPEESQYKDLGYAEKAYGRFVNDLLTKTTTTRASVFATIHRPATELLMRKMAAAGFSAYVGKLNMDRNSKYGLIETTEESVEETEIWLEETASPEYGNVRPIITPRYTPSCTDALMEQLGILAKKYNVPVQSHLSEGLEEIEWVKKLKPEISFYGEAYDMYGLFGSEVPTIMAHCIYPFDGEFELMKKRNITVAHCPACNMSAANGVAPVLDYLEAGIKVGLGSDMAGSYTLNLLYNITAAINASKARFCLVEQNGDPYAKKHFLTVANAFYLATKGGGQFFGKVGSFEEGYEFDAVVYDSRMLNDFRERSAKDRFHRLLWTFEQAMICSKFIKGKLVYENPQFEL